MGPKVYPLLISKNVLVEALHEQMAVTLYLGRHLSVFIEGVNAASILEPIHIDNELASIFL